MIDNTAKATWTGADGKMEDVWHVEQIRKRRGLLPTWEMAMQFSFENPPEDMWHFEGAWTPWGVHVRRLSLRLTRVRLTRARTDGFDVAVPASQRGREATRVVPRDRQRAQ